MSKDATDARYAALHAKLERDFPGINDPSNERFYLARMTGRQMREMIDADYARAMALVSPSKDRG